MKIIISILICIIILNINFLLVNSITQYNAIILNNPAQQDHKIDSYVFKLIYTGSNNYFGNPSSPIIKQLKFQIRSLTQSDFYFKITDFNNPRFQIPQGQPFPQDLYKNNSYPFHSSAFSFYYNITPFNFKITRKESDAILFSSYNKWMIFSQHFIKIESQLDTQYIYGLGQRLTNSFKKKSGKWTIFNRNRVQSIDKGVGLQTSGYYPFYMIRQRQNFFHINYLRSSNAIDVLIQQQFGKVNINWIVIGGVLDFRFFLGKQNPQQTINMIRNYMGLSAIPPFWSLGFNQCRWGYKNSTNLLQVISNFQKNNIPLDTIWMGEYQTDSQSFTLDLQRYPQKDVSKIIQNYNLNAVVNPQIKITNSTIYLQGMKRNIFIKSKNNTDFVGYFKGNTSFIDFFHPNSTSYWNYLLTQFNKKVNFSGLWLNMNQYANFRIQPQLFLKQSKQNKFDYSKDLPYQPGSDNLQTMTISLNATHYNNLKEADVHAFTGILQTYLTNKFLQQKGIRPFIVSKSITLGSNKYGFHIKSNNIANFACLKGSISNIFNAQMWGFQMTGDVICGYQGNTYQQLCARWFQIGSLYPFAFNHNAIYNIDQEPYALGQKVLESSKVNLRLRYSLLKHYYTIFVTQKGKGTIFKPLFFIFPLNNNLYKNQITDTQFMIGESLMSSPIVQQSKDSRQVYFPEGKWYDFYTGALYVQGENTIKDIKITDKVPLFLREGYCIFIQKTDKVRSSKDLNNNDFFIIAALKFDKEQVKNQNKTNNNKNQQYQAQKYYKASGKIMGIKDFNDQLKVSQCIKNECNYNLNLKLTLTDTNKSKFLQLDFIYLGQVGLANKLTIQGISLFFQHEIIRKNFQKFIVIDGSIKLTIQID